MDESPPITMTPLSFTIDERMVSDAALLHLGRYRAYFIGAVAVWVIMSMMPVLLRIGTWDTRNVIWYAAQNAAITLMIAALLLAFLRWLFFPLIARRNFRQQKAFALEMQLSWNDADFRYATGRSQTLARFSDLYGYRMSDAVLLLYLSNVLYLLVPRSALDAHGDAEDFITRLDAADVRRL